MLLRIVNYILGYGERLNPIAAFFCVIFATLILFGTGLEVFDFARGSGNAHSVRNILVGLFASGTLFYVAYRKWLSQKAGVKKAKSILPQQGFLTENPFNFVRVLNSAAWLFAFYVFIKIYQYLFIN